MFSSGTGVHDSAHTTPLPWFQLSIVYLIDTVDSMACAVINPFINQFVRDTGITQGDERRTGYFAGIILSASYLSEALTVVPLGMISDRVGRKPVVLIGPLGLCLVTLAFGMSDRFWLLFIFRFMLGAFSGNVDVVKTIIGEITDPTNIADAFAYFPVTSMSGSVIGAFIGGLLAYPAKRWPGSLGKVTYLRTHPYFLPCLAAAILTFTIYILATIVLKETLPSALARKRQTNSQAPLLATGSGERSYGTNGNNDRGSLPRVQDESPSLYSDERCPLSLMNLFKLPDVQIVLINSAFMGFCNLSVQALTPLMWSMPINLGGLGWSAYRIGMTMAAYNLITGLQIPFLAKLIRRFGAKNVYLLCFSSLLVSFLSFPVASFFAKAVDGNNWRVWAAVVVSLAAQSLRLGALASLQIILTRSAPNQSSLGTINGLGQGVMALMCCLGPFVASSLHSISLQHQLLNGNAVYYIMAATVACGIRFCVMIPERLCQR